MSPNQSAAACFKTSGDASSCIPQPRAIPDSRSHEPEPVSSSLPQDLRGRQQLYTPALCYSRQPQSSARTSQQQPASRPQGTPAAVYPSLELFPTAAVMNPNQSAAACLKTSDDVSSCIPQPRAIPDSRSHEPEPVSSRLPQDLRGRQQLTPA